MHLAWKTARINFHASFYLFPLSVGLNDAEEDVREGKVFFIIRETHSFLNKNYDRKFQTRMCHKILHNRLYISSLSAKSF
jgi:hypothetical protein